MGHGDSGLLQECAPVVAREIKPARDSQHGLPFPERQLVRREGRG